MITELNTKNFEKEISNGLKLVEFFTTWCGYCKKQKPELEKMDKIWIGLVDADEFADIAKTYKITGFPTFLVFKDGKEVERFSGFRTKEEIMERLIKHLK